MRLGRINDHYKPKVGEEPVIDAAVEWGLAWRPISAQRVEARSALTTPVPPRI